MLRKGKASASAAATVTLLVAAVLSALLLAPVVHAAPGDVLPIDPSATGTTTALATATLTATPASVAATDTPSPTPTPTDTATTTPTPTPTDTTAPAPAPSAPAAPAPVAPAPPAPVSTLPPLVMPAQLGSWCEVLFPAKSAATEKKLAQQLMAGKVDMGDGGIYYLSARPNWAPQSGTDTSGDRHVNSLHWALPLLYRGVHKQNPALVERFRQLLYYWIDDHKGKRGAWVDGSIYGGLRSETLVCAAQTLNEPVLIEAALRDARTMMSGFRAPPVIAVGANNTDLIRQTGAFATYCWVGDVASRERAWANLVGVAHGVVQNDGSDVEGSPGYAMYIEKLLTDVEKAATNCGLMSDNIKALRQSLYSFVAQAVRPDFKVESLGDTTNQSLRGGFGIGEGNAEWIRSGGASGDPSAPIYGAFDGGYVFGRAGWRPQPGGPDTYYSLRFSSSRPATAHTHDDGAGLTIFSRGVSWIGDPGPYRYDNGSSLRWYMKSRPAHSSFAVSNVSRDRGKGVRKVQAESDWSLGGNDRTCLVDKTWGTVKVTRCVTYVRSIDAIVVVDYTHADKLKKKQRKHKRVITERWQLPPGVGAQNVNDVITLIAGDKRMDVYKSGPGTWSASTARSGSNAGWFTTTWGKKLPGAVLSRQATLKGKGGNDAMVTVFVPRVDGETVPVTIDANGVTITRGAMTITTPLPVAP